LEADTPDLGSRDEGDLDITGYESEGNSGGKRSRPETIGLPRGSRKKRDSAMAEASKRRRA